MPTYESFANLVKYDSGETTKLAGPLRCQVVGMNVFRNKDSGRITLVKINLFDLSYYHECVKKAEENNEPVKSKNMDQNQEIELICFGNGGPAEALVTALMVGSGLEIYNFYVKKADTRYRKEMWRHKCCITIDEAVSLTNKDSKNIMYCSGDGNSSFTDNAGNLVASGFSYADSGEENTNYYEDESSVGTTAIYYTSQTGQPFSPVPVETYMSFAACRTRNLQEIALGKMSNNDLLYLVAKLIWIGELSSENKPDGRTIPVLNMVVGDCAKGKSGALEYYGINVKMTGDVAENTYKMYTDSGVMAINSLIFLYQFTYGSYRNGPTIYGNSEYQSSAYVSFSGFKNNVECLEAVKLVSQWNIPTRSKHIKHLSTNNAAAMEKTYTEAESLKDIHNDLLLNKMSGKAICRLLRNCRLFIDREESLVQACCSNLGCPYKVNRIPGLNYWVCQARAEPLPSIPGETMEEQLERKHTGHVISTPNFRYFCKASLKMDNSIVVPEDGGSSSSDSGTTKVAAISSFFGKGAEAPKIVEIAGRPKKKVNRSAPKTMSSIQLYMNNDSMVKLFNGVTANEWVKLDVLRQTLLLFVLHSTVFTAKISASFNPNMKPSTKYQIDGILGEKYVPELSSTLI